MYMAYSVQGIISLKIIKFKLENNSPVLFQAYLQESRIESSKSVISQNFYSISI